MKVINQRNYIPKKGKRFTGKSETVQGEDISLAKLLARHVQGESLKARVSAYSDPEDETEPDLEKFHHMDPVDREDVLEGIRAMTHRLRGLEAEMKASKKATSEPETKADASGHI